MRPEGAAERLPGRAARDMLGRAARNFGTVMTGQAVGTVLGLVALTLNSRALPPEDLGTLFLILAAGEIALAICSFQNWRMVIRFGAEAIAAGDGPGLRAIWRFGLLLDLATAACAAGVVLALFLTAPHLLGLSEAAGRMGAFYAVTLVFGASGSSIGLLRLCEAFRVVVGVEMAGAGLLCLNALLLYAAGAPLGLYLLTIPAITAFTPLVLILLGWLRMRRVAAGLTARPDGASFRPRAMMRFALGSSGVTTLNAIQNRGELLIVGFLLGPAAGALFGVAYRFAAIFARFAEAGRQSIYPEMAHLVAAGRFPEAVRMALRLTRIAALVSLPALAALGLAGPYLLGLFFGPDYAGAYPAMMLVSAGMAVGMAAFALDPLIQLSWGAERFFLLSLIAFAGFAVAAVAGPLLFGAAGAGAGRLGFTVVLALLSLGLIRRQGKGGSDA